MSEEPMRYWIRIAKLPVGLIVGGNGIFSDKESCEECGYNCYEATQELAKTVAPNDIKGRVVRDIEGGKISRLSGGKSAIDLD